MKTLTKKFKNKISVGIKVDVMAEIITDTFDQLKPQYWQIVQHTDAVKLITSSSKTRAIIYGQLTWCDIKFRVELLETLDDNTLVQAIYPL